MLQRSAALATYIRDWTQRVGGLTRLPALVRQCGADPAALIAAAGIEADAFDEPEGRVAYAALSRLLNEAAVRTQRPHFGLLAGAMQPPHELGLAAQLALNAPTVRNAIETFVVYQHLNSAGGLTFVLERGGQVDFGYAIYHPEVQATRVLYDTLLAASLNFMRALCGPAWVPSEVLIPYAQPDDVAPYRSLFKAPLRFDQEISALRFPARFMEQRVVGADPIRFSAARRLAETTGPGELVQQVFRALRVLMLSGDHAGDEVASMLTMHRRTLNRRLKAEGTTFRHVLDQVRFDVARQLLSESRISLDDIAAALGYADVRPFMRTFRRWSGTPPGQWRDMAVSGKLGAGAVDGSWTPSSTSHASS